MKSINSNQEFNDLVTQDKPVLLDFYADWCGPCQMLLPTVEKIAKEFEGIVEIHKVNIDDNPAIASKFGVRSIPTLLFIKDKKILDRINGMTSEVTLRKKLKRMI